MSNSFFVSSELKNIVTPDIISGNTYSTPFVCINVEKYSVIGVERVGLNGIKLSFTCDERLKLSDYIIIKTGNVFGILLENVEASFEKLYYDKNQKKHICEIVIDKDNFWS